MPQGSRELQSGKNDRRTRVVVSVLSLVGGTPVLLRCENLKGKEHYVDS